MASAPKRGDRRGLWTKFADRIRSPSAVSPSAVSSSAVSSSAVYPSAVYPRRGRSLKAVAFAPALALATAGCVTTYESVDLQEQAGQVPVAVPVAIPIPDLGEGESRLLLDFYSGILRRLQQAASEGDVALLDSLVDSYDKPSVPESIQEHLAGYRAIARGIAFQQHLARHAVLELLPAAAPGSGAADASTVAGAAVEPPLGQDLLLELRVPPMDREVRMGGYGDAHPIGFSIAVTIEDQFFDGRTRSSHTDGFQWLPETFHLAPGDGDGAGDLRLPINIGAAAGNAVRRDVTVRVDLMPGYVTFDEIRGPVHRTTVGAGSFTQWPSGHEILRKQPMKALRAALRDFQPSKFASAYLAASFVPADKQHEACGLLMDQVRLGRVDQGLVAMAALQKASGLSIAVGDRDAWLAWWQTQDRR